MNRIAPIVAVLAAASPLLAGCSPHEDSPKTPSMSSTTPTYRTTVSSGDQNLEPFYLTPGVNTGTPARPRSIPAPDRFNANAPLAVAVYNALLTDHTVDVKYIAVEGKRDSVWIQGTVKTAEQKAEIVRIARATAGVKAVKDDVTVQ